MCVLQTKRQLKDGIDLGDKALILAALARADAFKAEWGEIDIPTEQFELARSTLDVIEKEEAALSGIRTALAQNGLQGTVGALVAKDVNVSALQSAVHLVQPATVRTKLGNALVTFAKVLLDGDGCAFPSHTPALSLLALATPHKIPLAAGSTAPCGSVLCCPWCSWPGGYPDHA